MNIQKTHATMDALLLQWQPALGRDYDAYRNHVFRVYHFACGLAGAEGDEAERIAVAAAFHDIGIWLDGTFDYLKPSELRAEAYLAEIGREDWAGSINQMIEQHHKVSRWRGPDEKLVESFRQADWLDVCFCLPSTPLPQAFVREVVTTFPRLGFQGRLVQFTLAWARKHPLNWVPVLKW